jgi:GTP 3',8-cyclase
VADRFRIDSEKMSLHPKRVAQWLDAREDWEKAKDVFPIYVEVSPVGYCNHACTFCGVDYMLDRPEKPQLRPEVMKAMLTDMAEHGVLSVMFAGAGEPLLYKPLADTLHHCDAVGIDTSITTNGVLMNEAFCRRALTAKRLRWIKVSINGGDAETYQAIHRSKNGDFEKVIENLATAVRIRREVGGTCTIGAQMVALPETRGTSKDRPLIQQTFPSNLDTAGPLAARLRETGIDYLVIKPYSQHLMSERTRVYDGTRYDDSWARGLEQMSTDTFNVVVRRKTMSSLASDDRGYSVCHATPFQWAYVEADGEVWGCSAYLGRDEGGVHYGDDRFRFGNVSQQSFAEVWRNERRRACFEYVRTSLNIDECRTNCRMHHVNMYLQNVLDPGPHASFI